MKIDNHFKYIICYKTYFFKYLTVQQFTMRILKSPFSFFTLIHGDTMVLDRWLWLKSRLPSTLNKERLIDLGCGSGAFSINSALRGYNVVGLSYDAKNNYKATQRTKDFSALNCVFYTSDLNELESFSKTKNWLNTFDICINFENIEHMLDDKKLIKNIFDILKPGGRLLITAPSHICSDPGPFSITEDGGHVRRGYSKVEMMELFNLIGFELELQDSCSGFFSQKITRIFGRLSLINSYFAWLVILPFRLLPLVFDPVIRFIFGYKDYSVCFEAIKPRLNSK
jgi:SAM-dependent methyltransferase